MEFCPHFGQFVRTVHKHQIYQIFLALHFLQNSTPFWCKTDFCSSKTVKVVSSWTPNLLHCALTLWNPKGKLSSGIDIKLDELLIMNLSPRCPPRTRTQGSRRGSPPWGRRRPWRGSSRAWPRGPPPARSPSPPQPGARTPASHTWQTHTGNWSWHTWDLTVTIYFTVYITLNTQNYLKIHLTLISTKNWKLHLKHLTQLAHF